MAVTHLDRRLEAGRAASSRRRPQVRWWAPDAAALVAGAGLGWSIFLPFSQVTSKALAAPGGVAVLLGDVTAMAGTYLLLVMVLLAGRIPALETALGQDRLLLWHRRLSSAPLLLIGAHGVLSTLGYAQASRIGFLAGVGSLITTMAFIFASIVGYLMLVGIAVLSIRAARRRFSYDTWWVIHLYTYLALAFSVPHQILDGTNFVGRPVTQALWLLLWGGTAGVVALYRLGLPAYRTVRHRPELVRVYAEGPGVYSLLVRGRDLDRLPLAGGQYFGWRFLTRDLWWHAHPFSISALPTPHHLRVTVKAAGDATARIAALRPGTRILLEGPYGAFTDALRTRPKVALIGAGVGITPLRALLEDLPQGVDAVVVQRASSGESSLHHAELAQLVEQRLGRLVELVGSRHEHPLGEPAYLHRLVPDLAQRDVYVCGPDGFSAGVVAAARALGVPATAIHRESFEF